MRTTGIILLWLGIIIVVLVLLLAGLSPGLSALDSNAEVFGWMLIFAMFFGIPAAVLGGIMILIGAVLVTAFPKPEMPTSAPPPSDRSTSPAHIIPGKSRSQPSVAPRGRSEKDPLRAAINSGASNLHRVALALRILAVGLFVWVFVPQVYNGIKLYSSVTYLTGPKVMHFALIVATGLVMAAIVPLVLWLVSNLIKTRANRSDAQFA